MDLLRILKQISAPLPYEEKKGYTNQTVKGGYALFASHKIQEVLDVEKRDQVRLLLNNLLQSLHQYGRQPDKNHFLSLSSSINVLRQYLLQPVNQLECHSLLKKPLRYLKGVGPKREELFCRLGIETLWDLLHYFPRDYMDRSKIVPITSAINGERQTFQGQVNGVSEMKKGRLRILKVSLWDQQGMLSIVFFNQAYLKKVFESRLNQSLIVSGKVSWQYHHWQMDNPEFEWAEDQHSSLIHTSRIVPLYRLTDGLFLKSFRSVVFQALEDHCQLIYNVIPTEILDKYAFPNRAEAIRNMHFPPNAQLLEKSRQSLAFEEFLLGQFALLQKKASYQTQSSPAYSISTEDQLRFEELLPYALSDSQRKVIQELKHDLEQSYPMNRLIHGDVGSGKTTVAASALFYSFLNGYQAAFMAPTEILARQCYHNFHKLFYGLGLRSELLISDIREKDRKQILSDLKDGKINIMVGTHALIQHDVVFNKLGLMVVDEQHRFGVKQRLELRKKGIMPHLLVMSATPIPRTLAMTRYGDLDTSLIDQMPLGKKRIKTKILSQQKTGELYTFVKKKLSQGGKAFVVCPLIEESEKMELASSIEKAEQLAKEFKEFSVLLLHGKMNSKEKDEIMQKFSSSEGHILVSTTVIEVGIDIPEANIMIVENADRFGLAQLHQLRGRIGRQSQEAYCFLLLKNKDNTLRLQVLEDSDSGFVVAEKDLELRGPGELWGERQSGFMLETLIRLERDAPLLEKAKEAAIEIMQSTKYKKIIETELQFRAWPIVENDPLASG
jgi:ATP-dependent DNA helicase RecG